MLIQNNTFDEKKNSFNHDHFFSQYKLIYYAKDGS